MFSVEKKIKTVYLYITFAVLLAGTVLSTALKTEVKSPYYDELYNSAKRMERVLEAVEEYCITNGIELEENDINKTYLLGPEVSELMSTLGYEDLKRTTLNPNNAAIVASYFIKAGLKKGDVVGVGSSGSFPGYAIATLCAATELGLKTRVIASYGSSMFGATRPELNIVTILKIARDCGAVDFDLVAVSPGSSGDRGVGAWDGFIFENTRELVLGLAADSGAPLIDPESMEQSIELRKQYLGSIDCFVNVGGAGANSGIGSTIFPEGLVTEIDFPTKDNDKGLVYEYAGRGLPVINLLNTRKITLDNGMEIDPSPMPECGVGGVYYQTGYPAWIIVVSIVLSITVLLYGVLKTKSFDIKK